jgi:hypothetical protein
MKKIFVSSIVAALVVAGMSGCASKKEDIVAKDAPSKYALEFEGAPEWVTSPSAEGGLSSVGSAKIGPAGVQFAETEATGIARDGMARQITTNVSNMLKNFTQQTGVGNTAVVDKVVSDVSKQLAQQDLSGSRLAKKWISKTGTMWVLVVMSDNKTAEKVKETVKTSYKNDEALWQQFQAKKAQDELDASLSKLNAK